MSSRTEQLIEEWKEFCKEVEEHIKNKGQLYDLDKTSVIDLLSAQFCIESIIKYAFECFALIKDEKGVPPKATLYSIAHLAQIIERRYYHAPIVYKRQ